MIGQINVYQPGVLQNHFSHSARSRGISNKHFETPRKIVKYLSKYRRGDAKNRTRDSPSAHRRVRLLSRGQVLTRVLLRREELCFPVEIVREPVFLTFLTARRAAAIILPNRYLSALQFVEHMQALLKRKHCNFQKPASCIFEHKFS